MRKILLIMSIVICSFAHAQAPAIEWQQTYGGSSNETMGSMAITSDGGYVAVGTTSSDNGDVTGYNGQGDVWLVKFNSFGELEWQKTFGGSNGDFGRSVAQTSDGGYIIAGASSSNDGDVSGGHGSADCWVIKLDNTGTIEWQRTFGGSNFDDAYSIRQTLEGGFIFLARIQSNDGDLNGNVLSEPDLWVVKISATGILEWQKTYGGAYDEFAFEINQTNDTGYIVAAATRSSDGDITNFHGIAGDNFDAWILKLNPTGEIEWQKCYGGTGSEFNTYIQQTIDGGYIFVTDPDSSDGDVEGAPQATDIWIVKINNTGTIEWQTMYGGSSYELIPFIKQTLDSGYIVAAQTQSNNGDVLENNGQCDMWVLRLNETGELQWQKSFGGTGCDYSESIIQTTDGGYLIGGHLAFTGSGGNSDFFVAKLAPENLATSNFEKNSFTLYPNPSQTEIWIKANDVEKFDQIICRDITGKIVATYTKTNSINIENFSLGIYTIEVNSVNKVYRTKFIKN